jgi:hypothetical protein
MTDKTGGLAGWWQGLKNKTAQVVADKEAEFANGKIAGVTVTDDDGNVLVEPGHRIDDRVIDRARQAGKLGALASAAAKAQAQDIKERVETTYSHTDSGREAMLLNSVEEYREARNYLHRILTMDVTDIRGNIVVPAGKELDDEDIRRARDAGLLSAFLVAAQQSLPPVAEQSAPVPPPSPVSAAPRRPPILLATPDEESETSGTHVSDASR